MSATDSDNSVNWLVSDTEDNGSALKPQCGEPGAPPTAARAPRLDSEVNDSDGDPAEDRAGAGGPCRRNGAQPQAAKRRHGAAEDERRQRPRSGSGSERDRLFSSKCMELQCYIHPLSSILNGLRSGRYRERLSSFQESVAMDRIQRIMGVLQNPCMGERYVNIILKMEEMLKSWFPNVKLHDEVAATQTEEAVSTKKPKLSPVTPTAAIGPVTAGDPPVGAKALRVTDLTPPGAYSASNLKWLHTSPICSPAAEQAPAGPRRPLSPADEDPTQDNAVSSSTDSRARTDSVPRGPPPPPPPPPPPGKISAPCLERLLRSTESIITRRGTRGLMDSSWS
ncbi:circadian-associated transcriptional repressor [Betta splendens]|uniref:Circadian-associated transcriptional repressor n=1 Tax=Betta splendens TaxID=158456 RepID=A0A6P7MVD2_BETSP|nr:circadian-associated transcriptional repressor [Betta splendens]XP_040927201.1 circadian-associated transcriptional repressor [Betta splendens]